MRLWLRTVPADITDLQDQLEAVEREAEALVAGLSEEQGTRWRGLIREPIIVRCYGESFRA